MKRPFLSLLSLCFRLQETEGLENQKQSLESEIQQLQAQKEQLEFLLQAHTPLCNAKDKLAHVEATAIITKVDMPRSSAALSRPTTLPISSHATTKARNAIMVTVTEATGVPITTPSAVFGTFGLDSMMDGHTGLTPLTGAPSCASEAQRNSSDSSPDALSSPTTLMAL